MEFIREKYPKISELFDFESLNSELKDFLIVLLIKNEIKVDLSKIIDDIFKIFEGNTA